MKPLSLLILLCSVIKSSKSTLANTISLYIIGDNIGFNGKSLGFLLILTLKFVYSRYSCNMYSLTVYFANIKKWLNKTANNYKCFY
jgi:hypothetical protein